MAPLASEDTTYAANFIDDADAVHKFQELLNAHRAFMVGAWMPLVADRTYS